MAANLKTGCRCLGGRAVGRQGNCNCPHTLHRLDHLLCRVPQRCHLRCDLRIRGLDHKTNDIALDRQSAHQIMGKDGFPIRQGDSLQLCFNLGFGDRHRLFLLINSFDMAVST